MKLKFCRLVLSLLVIMPSLPIFNFQSAFADHVTVLLEDNFNDNFLNSTDWTEIDSEGDLAEINSHIEITIDASNDTDAHIKSTSSTSTGKVSAQAFLSLADPVLDNTFRLSLQGNLIFAIGDDGTDTIFVNDGGLVSTGISLGSGKDLKIEYNVDTFDVTYSYWDGSGWVILRSTNFDNSAFFPLKVEIHGTTQGNGDSLAIADDVFFTTDNFYTTHYPNQGCPAEIILQDNFDDNFISTGTWTITDFNSPPLVFLNETNNRIQIVMTELTSDALISSVNSRSSGVITLQAFLDQNVTTDHRMELKPFHAFDSGIWLHSNGTVNTFRTVTDIDDFATDITGGKDVKLEYNLDTFDIEFFYWDGASWIQMWTTQNTGDLTEEFPARLVLQGQVVATPTNSTGIGDDVFFTVGTYTTHYPTTDCEEPPPAPPSQPTGGGTEVVRGQQQAFDQAVADAIASIQVTEQSPLEQLISTFFDFQVIDTQQTDLPLQSLLQNQRLGIRWSHGDDILIVGATPAQSPFFFNFEQFPVIKHGSGSFVSESYVLYNIEVPKNQCSAVLTENCIERIRYEVPITVNAIINKTQVSDTGFIIVDLTKGAIDPIIAVLVALTAIPIIGAILHKRGGGNLTIPVRRVVS